MQIVKNGTASDGRPIVYWDDGTWSYQDQLGANLPNNPNYQGYGVVHFQDDPSSAHPGLNPSTPAYIDNTNLPQGGGKQFLPPSSFGAPYPSNMGGPFASDTAWNYQTGQYEQHRPWDAYLGAGTAAFIGGELLAPWLTGGSAAGGGGAGSGGGGAATGSTVDAIASQAPGFVVPAQATATGGSMGVWDVIKPFVGDAVKGTFGLVQGKLQSDAASQATAAQIEQARRALELQRQMFNQAQQTQALEYNNQMARESALYGNQQRQLAPYIAVGQGALGNLARMMDVTPSGWQAPTLSYDPLIARPVAPIA